MDENDGIAVRLGSGGMENRGNHNTSHCNGGPGKALTSDLDFRKGASMEEVTCKLKGLKVSYVLLL